MRISDWSSDVCSSDLKKALRATKANLAYFENQRVQLEATNLKRREEARNVAAKVEGVSVVVIRQAGESGQLYGSVSARDIAEALTEQGYTVDRSQVRSEENTSELQSLMRTSYA